MRLQQIGARLDVRGVSDDDLGVTHRRLRGRRAQRGGAGAEPDDAQAPGWAGAAGNGHRGNRVRLLVHDELGTGPGGQQGGGLGDAGRADGVGDNCARGRHGDLAERIGREPAQRQPERAETRLARLPIECRDLGHGRACEPGAVECGVEEVGHGVRRRTGRRADAGDERRWVQRHDAGLGCDASIGHD